MGKPSSIPPGDNINQASFLQRVFIFFKKLFKSKAVTFEESVSELIREHNDDASIHDEEKAMLQNIITFGDLEASDIMLPRTEIIAAPITIKPQELNELFLKEGHSRIPIYNHSIDDILGFIHLKDFYKWSASKKKFNIRELTRELTFVPRTIKIPELLTRMKQTSSHIAIVLDEYGGTDGLLTIEDIFEEIFGEIKDEYEDSEQYNLISQDGDGFLIDAKARIEDVEHRIGIKLEKKHGYYDTFGGYLITLLGYIPKIGEKFKLPSKLEVEVIEANQRKVKMLKVTSL